MSPSEPSPVFWKGSFFKAKRTPKAIPAATIKPADHDQHDPAGSQAAALSVRGRGVRNRGHAAGVLLLEPP